MVYSKYSPILSGYTKLEKILILVFICHSIAFLVSLLKLVRISYLYLFLYLFLLISFITTILIRTLLHGFIFCFLNSVLLMAIAVKVDNSCGDKKCVYVYGGLYNTYVNSLIVLAFFEFMYILLTILLWYKKQWKFIKDIGNTKKTNINKMYKKFQCQTGFIHANFLSITIWVFYMLIVEIAYETSDLENYDIKTFIINVTMPDQIIYLISLSFILKVIRYESKKTIYFIHLLNLLECFLIIYRTAKFCPVSLIIEYGDSSCNISYKFRNFHEYQITLIGGTSALSMTLMQSISLILCHRNFGNDLGFYLKYEEIPSEFEYKDDIPMKRNQEKEKYIEQV